jgi:hypothetical protein
VCALLGGVIIRAVVASILCCGCFGVIVIGATWRWRSGVIFRASVPCVARIVCPFPRRQLVVKLARI